MEIDFKKAKNDSDLLVIENLAKTIWHEAYSEITSKSQINYMLSKFQSFTSLRNQIEEESYIYYLILLEKKSIGYVGYKIENEKLFLSKIYLLDEHRGIGIASKAFNFIEETAKNNNCIIIYLAVNKNNIRGISFYKKEGFKISNEVVTDIGNNYVMDDYIMEKEI